MAVLIPAFSSCSQRMTAGERRFAQRLESKLEDDYLLWYDVPIGTKRLHPDFILLHPIRGIIILEVKDWKLDTIQQVDKESVTLLTAEGLKTVQNPLQQARNYALAVQHLLAQDSLLIQTDGLHRGKLAFPYSYGVVLTNITRDQFDAQEELPEVLQANLVMCRDEFYETVDPMEFQQRLWNFCTHQFGEPLTVAQIDRVRWHLFPEVRIGQQLSLNLDAPLPKAEEPEAIAIPDIIRVMDIQQEQLARSLGEGHRIIHGVAGSGKTLILVYRCLRLLKESSKPVLVLCFNVSLAARLRQLLHEKGAGDRVIVRNFHKWCSDLLWQYRIQKPSYQEFSGEAYCNEMVQRLIQAVESKKIPSGQYGAVLIDEGHDFQPDWFKLVVQMVDPLTNSLLLLYDDAQNLYSEAKQKKFSFKRVGIQAQGRTTILKVNYRNTQEVLSVAYEFAKELMTPTTAENEEDEPVLVQPQSAGRHGSKPQLIKFPNWNAEVHYLLERTQQLHNRGIAWNDIAIIYREKWMAESIVRALETAHLPIEWINRDTNSRNYHPDEQSIKLVTMHSSKGLEFPIVFIPGLGRLPNPYHPVEDEARLLYVAMTRAVDELVMTCDHPSRFAKKVNVALSHI